MYTYTTIQEVSLPELEMWSFIYESNPPLMATSSVSTSSEKQAHTQHYRINVGLIAITVLHLDRLLSDADVFYSKMSNLVFGRGKLMKILTPWTFRSFALFWCVFDPKPGWWKTRDLRLWNNQTWIEPPIVLCSSSCILDFSKGRVQISSPVGWIEERGNVRYLDTRMEFTRYT